MFKRISVTLGAIALLAMGAVMLTPEVSAHGGGDSDGSHDGDKGKGDRWKGFENWIIPGTLDAEGEGIAAAAGGLNLELCGEGLLLVKRGEAEPAVDSYDDSIEWLGLQVFFGFHGCAQIEGKRVAALVVGSGLTMHAEGIGIAFLKGEGTYEENGGDPQDWPADGGVVKIGQKLKNHETPEPEPSDEPEPTSSTPT